MHLTVINCTSEPGPSRFERRYGRCLSAPVAPEPGRPLGASTASVTAQTIHLGTFEGAHNSHHDDEESECLLKAFLSLFAIVAALSALAAFTWGM